MACGAANSLLLTLPAEIRNHVYRYALTEPDGTYYPVTARGITEPGVLTACKILRQEATPIFYGENTFELDLPAFQCAAACFFETKISHLFEHFRISAPRTVLGGLDSANCDNLMTWMKHHHEGRTNQAVLTPTQANLTSADLHLEVGIVGRMFHTVRVLRKARWAKVEKVLTEDREVLGLLDSEWKD